MQNSYSNYPTGFDNGMLFKQISISPNIQSSVYWVGNNSSLEAGEAVASNTNPGTYLKPFADLAFAISQCKANNINEIKVRSTYTQTISQAADLNIDVAGLKITGIGTGEEFPTLTFGTSTAATCTITAANVTMTGFIGTNTLDQIVSPFVVSAPGVTLDLEWRDSADNIEALRAVLTTAAADNFTLNLNYKGRVSGTHCVNAVRLVGCDNGIINVNVNGKFSAASVEFFTTACTNVQVYGYMYNAASSGANKDIVDTVTGSTWFAYFYDGQAGAAYSGGSGAALAPTVPASQTLITNNMEQSITRASSTLPQTGTQNLFTVSGAPIEIIDIVGFVTTVIGAAANNAQLEITDTASSTTTTICAALNIANAAVGTTLHIDGTLADAMIATPGGVSTGQANRIICPVGIIKLTCSASDTGQVQWFLRYRPLGTSSSVVAD